MTHRFLITGGAGFLGINLIRFLVERGHAVSSLDVAEFQYPDVVDRIQIIQSDIRDPGVVDRALEGVDIVVHAAAALPLYPHEEIYTTNINGTRIVLEATYRRGIRRLIHISSTAVYGIPDHHPLLEDDRLSGVGPYGGTKVQAEGICHEYRRRGLCLPILRPKSFVGPERLGVFALLYEWASEGKHFPILGSGRNRYQLLDVEDLCQAVVLAADGPEEQVNDVFNIGARQFSTVREEFQAVLDEAGYGRRVISIPAAPARAMLRLLERLHLSPLYQWTYDTIATDSFVSVEKAGRVLGFRPRYSNVDALLRNYRWYLDNKAVLGGSGVTHREAWNQGLLRLVKAFF